MNNFEKVFETCVNTIHKKNVNMFGALLAEVTKSGFVEMKPVFELTYNQGYEDAKNEMYKPLKEQTTCYTLNSTAEVIRKTVKVLYDLGLEGFGIGYEDEDNKCLVVWCDKMFTTTYDHEPDGGSTMVDVNKVYDNAEEFLETIKKELIKGGSI